MIDPILGIVLACEVPFVCEDVRSTLSCIEALGVGVRESVLPWDWAISGDGPKRRGSIGVEDMVEGCVCCICILGAFCGTCDEDV